MPKAVINTQRMLCSNQAMIATMLAFLQDEPPVMVDRLLWHHMVVGNHNIGLVLYNGGSLYIDDGKPTAAGIGETVRNLREIATTFYVNVPKGFETLLPALENDAELRASFFSRLRLMFYAGAHLAQHVWQALQRHALETTGERILMLTGLGATGDGAVRVHARQGGEPGGRSRTARARHRAQARAVGSTALRRPAQRPERHARLLAPAGGDRPGVR
jgi:feruloyl-CoA synthase